MVASDGLRSLREAVALANGTPEADTIVFASALEGKTLTLTGGELVLTHDVTIDGDKDNNGSEVTLSGGDSSRILHVTGDGTSVQFRDLTLTHGLVTGYDAGGGAILGDYGTAMRLSETTVRDNHATFVGGGISGDSVALVDSTVSGNTAGSRGGGIAGDTITLSGSSVHDNTGYAGGGIFGSGAVELVNSTISSSSSTGERYFSGGRGIYGYGPVSLSSSTITGNIARGDESNGGGILAGTLALANSIVAGNSALLGAGDDISGTVAASNGHNILGSDAAGVVLGDLQGIAPSLLFAAIDPDTGSGQVNAAGVVTLRNAVGNPALSGGDPLSSLPIDQLGHARPQPTGSLPDIGAAERNQTLSTHLSPNNDVVNDTDASHTLFGHGGSDLIRGHDGNDQLFGEGGNDVLDGGPGNDLLDGGDGIDLARFGGSTAVAIDLVAGTATRSAETDTLSSIQGAIGSSTADTFQGDGGKNSFQGGGGRDVATGGVARDVFDYDHTSDSRPGSTNRDVITDFAHNSDKIDLTGIDADATHAGNQAFVFVGGDALTGAGQVDFISSGGNTIVQASTDADSTPEFQIRLTGMVTLSEGDFIL
ncbi:MAG: calcium-binding protein [Geminicoccaceae bacterium]